MHPVEYRTAVVRMYDFSGSMRKISKALNVSTASISRWCKRLQPLKWKSREPKILPAIESAIKLILHDHPSTSASDLRSQIQDRFGINTTSYDDGVSQETILPRDGQQGKDQVGE
jgi:hypothetical protein